MRSKRTVRTRTALCAAVFFSAAAMVAVLAPAASAAPSAPLPLPVAGAGGEPLVNVDGHIFAQPLVNNLNLPTLKK